MFFVALLYGTGEGCDYTIGCNINFRVFTADSIQDALQECKNTWEEYGGTRGDPGIEEIDLYQIQGGRIDVPIGQWSDDEEKLNEQTDLEEELENLETEKRLLQKRLKEVKKTQK